MSLTNDDKQFINSAIRTAVSGESSRLEKMIVNKTDKLENKIVSEVSRLETLMEDDRSDTKKILELITDHLEANRAVKAHDERLTRLEQTEGLVLTTLNVHSREIKKLGGSTA